ncbi:hypothetical protein EXW72_12675 [Pseudomonas sp. BCA14]|nr:hypothetical protein EKA85_14020 [Pseudomonas veronii]TFF10288.1 hypothetical protein EXW70_14175 [Pseudomonas sp. JMN1]TFF12419.1 hypothetical protein EXW71_11925 [Pseudomonas sp. BCA17]TFF26045.1 hypothetical protein EXW73_15375 [Pseudomonas sp. BCA13]TFF29199.1 hypothetical protein EXW72_12675 [Pseudomonas sp. BCA14]
MLNEETCQIAL